MKISERFDCDYDSDELYELNIEELTKWISLCGYGDRKIKQSQINKVKPLLKSKIIYAQRHVESDSKLPEFSALYISPKNLKCGEKIGEILDLRFDDGMIEDGYYYFESE